MKHIISLTLILVVSIIFTPAYAIHDYSPSYSKKQKEELRDMYSHVPNVENKDVFVIYYIIFENRLDLLNIFIDRAIKNVKGLDYIKLYFLRYMPNDITKAQEITQLLEEYHYGKEPEKEERIKRVYVKETQSTTTTNTGNGNGNSNNKNKGKNK
jgi:hypothetical protein